MMVCRRRIEFLGVEYTAWQCEDSMDKQPPWNVEMEADLYIPVTIRAIVNSDTWPQTLETPAEGPSIDCWEVKLGDVDISDALPQDTVKEVYDKIWNHDAR